MEPTQNPNNINTPEKPRGAKLKATLLSVFIILIFIPISIYGVAFFFSFLTTSAFSGEGKYFIGSLGILLIFLALAYLAIRIFRSKIKTYLGPKSKLLFIVPILILALPILYFAIITFIATGPERTANNCEDFFSKNFQITEISDERLDTQEKAIKITARTIVKAPMLIALEGGSLYEEPLEKEHLIFELNFDDSENPKLRPEGTGEIKIGPETKEINFKITPSTFLTQPNYYNQIALDNWTNAKSFNIKKFGFYAYSEEGNCSPVYPIKRISPYGPYTTKAYTKQNFGL